MRRDCNGKFPSNWNSYLQNVSNNLDMCYYLPVFIAQIVFCEGKVVISTLAENILGSLVPDADESEYPLRPCTLYAANAVSHGYKHILIIANGTDIIGLGISFFSDIGADKLWLTLWNWKQIAEHYNS